jgi:hypothetical protein
VQRWPERNIRETALAIGATDQPRQRGSGSLSPRGRTAATEEPLVPGAFASDFEGPHEHPGRFSGTAAWTQRDVQSLLCGTGALQIWKGLSADSVLRSPSLREPTGATLRLGTRIEHAKCHRT